MTTGRTEQGVLKWDDVGSTVAPTADDERLTDERALRIGTCDNPGSAAPVAIAGPTSDLFPQFRAGHVVRGRGPPRRVHNDLGGRETHSKRTRSQIVAIYGKASIDN